MQYSTNVKNLANYDNSVDRMHFSFFRQCDFLPWMQMGKMAGQGFLLFSGQGYKSTFSEVPEQIQTLIKTKLTAFLEAPHCILRKPNVNSWSYFAQNFEQYIHNPSSFPIPDPYDPNECITN